jgi:hypothetical protein
MKEFLCVENISVARRFQLQLGEASSSHDVLSQPSATPIQLKLSNSALARFVANHPVEDF